MDDKYDKTSGKTATAELDHQPADRSTDAGLGMFERVNDLVGAHPIGTAPAIGGALEQEVDIDRLPGIVGVDRIRFTKEDDRYWRENHGNRHYANPASNYEEYQPAYQYGTDAAHRYQGRTWDDVQGDLERGWDRARGGSSLAWENVKDAVRAAWDRVERALPGDADHDGR
ncbi:MAG: hypothetical protein DMF53_18950 [Acidobacteria bacterium]|nr:MAG: hypothetical protein DMF53_18950 [Acidobacteriota bacterium]